MKIELFAILVVVLVLGCVQGSDISLPAIYPSEYDGNIQSVYLTSGCGFCQGGDAPSGSAMKLTNSKTVVDVTDYSFFYKSEDIPINNYKIPIDKMFEVERLLKKARFSYLQDHYPNKGCLDGGTSTIEVIYVDGSSKKVSAYCHGWSESMNDAFWGIFGYRNELKVTREQEKGMCVDSQETNIELSIQDNIATLTGHITTPNLCYSLAHDWSVNDGEVVVNITEGSDRSGGKCGRQCQSTNPFYSQFTLKDNTQPYRIKIFAMGELVAEGEFHFPLELN